MKCSFVQEPQRTRWRRLWWWTVCSLVTVTGVVHPDSISGQRAGPVASAEAVVEQMDASKDSLVTLNLRDSTIGYVIQEISRQSGIPVIYNKSHPSLSVRITVNIKRLSALDATKDVLKETGLTAQYAPDGKTIMVGPAASKPASQDSPRSTTGGISGRVIDSVGQKGITGVTVEVVGMPLSVLTNEGGTFRLSGVPTGPHTLRARVLGYHTRTVAIHVDSGKVAAAVILLRPASAMLSEVVTTAVGQQSRLTIGNSVTSLNVDSIIKTVPVRNMTDILDAGRVPGLIVSRGNGAPGAPARVRIRGFGSITATNDPIIIIDGVRSYSNQTTNDVDAQYSVLDRIDINSVETVEVFKGPSASALYGSDAANGVIVVTTKRGLPGRTRWNVSTDQQWTTQPGSSPTLYYREGAPLRGGKPARCLLTEMCTNDTLMMYNYMDDPEKTILGTGNRQMYSLSADGGSETLRYFVSGQAVHELGLLKMSNADVAYLERTTGSPVPKWQRRPLSNSDISGVGQINLQLTPALRVGLTNSLNRSVREETPLKAGISVYERASPADSSLVTGSISGFRQRIAYRELRSRNVINGVWNPNIWWNVTGDVGYEMLNRRTTMVLRRGDCVQSIMIGFAVCDPEGSLTSGKYDRSVASTNVRITARPPQWKGIRVTPTIGANYHHEQAGNIDVRAKGLPPGGTSVVGASSIDVTESANEPVSLGLFLSTNLSLLNERLFTSFGTRVDASNALGTDVRPIYPKLDLSYLISQERWFPLRSTTLRLRIAYGHSAVQPAVGSNHRTYVAGTGVDNETVMPTLFLATLGNIDLRPERSTELEGGFEIGILNDRFTLNVTQYRKLTRDMLISSNVASSLGLIGAWQTNLGSVRNSGTEVAFDGVLRESHTWRWSVNGAVSRNRNILVQLADGFHRTITSGSQLIDDVFLTRFVEGYPLHGKWMRPVITYTDLNGDGVLIGNEILRSDSSVFIGGANPNYEVSASTLLGLWDNRITLSMSGQYTDGLAQANQNAIAGSWVSSDYNTNARANGALTQGLGGIRAIYDPSTPLQEQAAVRSGYSFVHVVSVLKLTSLSIRFVGPAAIARKLKAGAMSIAIQGSNLGLWTNYSGRDPNVNDSIVGNATRDSGNLPLPRTWGVNVSLNY